jgi:hypothetical protein
MNMQLLTSITDIPMATQEPLFINDNSQTGVSITKLLALFTFICKRQDSLPEHVQNQTEQQDNIVQLRNHHELDIW